MFKKLLLVNLILSCVLILSGCKIDESFSTDATPSYAKRSQVTAVEASDARSASQAGLGNDNYTGNVVTTTTPQTNVVAISPPSNMVSRPTNTTVVTQSSVPSPTESVPVAADEPDVRSTPDDVIGTY